MDELHQPVLLAETINGLGIKPDGIYVDGTFGRGGHAKAILQCLSPQGRLFSMDRDLSAVEHGRREFASDPRFYLDHDTFANIGAFAQRFHFLGKADGILLDLGVSSPQLDDGERGFSFLRDGPLDMRMDATQGKTASQWLDKASQEEIYAVLKDLGEERFAWRIAQAIIKRRQEQKIDTTRQLAELISEVVPFREKHKHPATRSFQAIRIYINQELAQLQKFLSDCLDVLAVGGRLAIISFHSLEDRLVKHFIQEQEKGDKWPIGLPVPHDQMKPALKRIGKAIKPTEDEVSRNKRARSAILRVAEKIA